MSLGETYRVCQSRMNSWYFNHEGIAEIKVHRHAIELIGFGGVTVAIYPISDVHWIRRISQGDVLEGREKT